MFAFREFANDTGNILGAFLSIGKVFLGILLVQIVEICFNSRIYVFNTVLKLTGCKVAVFGIPSLEFAAVDRNQFFTV
ncbi:hypothetical protein SDC9_179867 [bioreactor metagenome]|uniref:Uncharacterized protein n=1 Tax=bioreactor metagenome TaxID=1076179 RepID=A0A645H313_9ZZZZ